MKYLPWMSGLSLVVVLFFVLTLTRTACAVSPCFSSCDASQYWAGQHCNSIGCVPGAPGGNWFFCSTDSNGVGSYTYECQCNCGGHLCYVGDYGTVDPSCSP
jgi:hypothetical protein